MAFEDITNADVFAYARQRRTEAVRERVEALKAKYGETWRPHGKPASLPSKTVVAFRKPHYRRMTKECARDAWNCETRLGAMRIIQGNRCYLCLDVFTPDDPPTKEHVIPICSAGKRRRNILLAHMRCNALKADRDPTPEELAYLERVNSELADRIAWNRVA